MQNNLIRKSNSLIEASYKLSISQQKLILVLASSIKPEDDNFQPYQIGIKDFANLLGLKSNSIYTEVAKITKDLKSKDLTISTDKSLLHINWLSSVEYFKGSGIIELCFDPKLKPYLLQLKQRFTSYKLKEIIQLKSTFSIRLYELLKQYEKIGERTFGLINLRKFLGIKEKQYALYGDFKRKVLIQAQKELNEKNNISFKFEEIKEGRKVVKLKFLIKTRAIKPTQPQLPTNNLEMENIFTTETQDKERKANLEKLFEMLPKVFKSKKTIEKLIAENLEKHDFEYVSRNILYTNANSKAAKPGLQNAKGSNYRNYLSKALKEDFGLAFKEDLETANSIEQAQKAKIAAEEQQKREEEAKIEAEREVALKAKEYLESLDQAQYEILKKQAIRSLSPEDKEKLFEGRIQADYTVKRAMKKIAAEQLKLFPKK
jgi:plasmid replication initiation protein